MARVARSPPTQSRTALPETARGGREQGLLRAKKQTSVQSGRGATGSEWRQASDRPELRGLLPLPSTHGAPPSGLAPPPGTNPHQCPKQDTLHGLFVRKVPGAFSTKMTLESCRKLWPDRTIFFPPRTGQLAALCFSTRGSSWADRWAARGQSRRVSTRPRPHLTPPSREDAQGRPVCRERALPGAASGSGGGHGLHGQPPARDAPAAQRVRVITQRRAGQAHI